MKNKFILVTLTLGALAFTGAFNSYASSHNTNTYESVNGASQPYSATEVKEQTKNRIKPQTKPLNMRVSVQGDANSEGVVNVDDMLIVINNWGNCARTGAGATETIGEKRIKVKPCPDFDGDGVVGQSDLDIVQENWTQKPKPATNKNPDLNNDGVVGQADLKILLAAFGPCLNKNLPPNCKEDLNSDGMIGRADASILLAAWTSKEKPSLSFSTAERNRIQALITNDARPEKPVKDETERKTAGERERLTNKTEKIVARLTAALLRLQKLTERIETRIAKLKSQSVNVSESEKHLVLAKTSWDEAKTNIEAIMPALKVILSATVSADGKISLDKLKETISKAKKSLKETHSHLVEAISNLKPGINKTENRTLEEVNN